MPGQWTSSQRQAYPWALSGAVKGLTATETLGAYRAGGGEIRDADWYATFRAAFKTTGWRETIAEIPKSYAIPERMFTPMGADWKEEFHLSAEVEYFDLRTQSWEKKYVSANMPDIATKADWIGQMEQAMKDIETSPEVDWTKPRIFRDFLAERR